MIKIDGTTYEVPVIKLRRRAEFLDKYAQRTESGNLERELIGVFFNYELQLGRAKRSEYQRLWEALTVAEEFHEVTVPGTEGDYTFTAYFSNIGDELLRAVASGGGYDYYWHGLTVNFVAKSPVGS